jgi:serine/threonine protein kinase
MIMQQAKGKAAIGANLGIWTVEERLGAGGNGEVWKATASDGQVAALKVLSKVHYPAYKRFSDEISVMTQNPSTGIVPIIDYHLPADPRDELAWYAMPIGTPLQTHLRTRSIEERVDAISQIAKTLASLHDQGIVHRDVKPANMLQLEGAPRLADFGLVSYPAKARVTKTKETVGPRATMAPEARRGIKHLDLKATDVYSLAKSLWILLSGNTAGFDGQYSGDQSVSMRPYTGSLFIDPLELALEQATAHEPARRPSMREFGQMLEEWLQISGNWDLRNLREWPSTIGRIFPTVVPTFASWAGKTDILKALRFIASEDGLNHMFIPSGGGLDLTDVVESRREPEGIELHSSSQVLVLKPRELRFYHFVHSPRWSFFLLQTEPIEPIGVPGVSVDDGQELLTELPSGEYADPMVWETGEWNGQALPPGTRPISRFTNGSFAFFQKSSPYNLISETYDARHSRLQPDEFLAHVDALRLAVGDTQDQIVVYRRLKARGDLRHPV